jgi:hypothetical protein
VELAGLKPANKRLWMADVMIGATLGGHVHRMIWESAVTLRSLDPSPHDRGKGLGRRECKRGEKSDVPFDLSFALSDLEDLTRPEARSSIHERALAMARRTPSVVVKASRRVRRVPMRMAR